MKDFNIENIDKLIKFKNELNRVIDKKIASAELNESINNIASLPFSDIITLFEAYSEELINNNEGKKSVKKYIKTLKESKTLNPIYSFYKNIVEGYTNVKNGNMLLQEGIKLINNDHKLFLEEVNKLGLIVSEGIKSLDITKEDIDNVLAKKETILNSLDYIFSNKKTISSLNEHVKHMDNISVYLSLKEGKEITTNNTISDGNIMALINANINEANSEWEKELIERISLNYLSNNDNKTLFEKYKNECSKIINDIIVNNDDDISLKSQMNEMQINLANKDFKNESYVDDIIMLGELKDTLKKTWENE